MLPALCSAVNQPRCTNHQLRCTAIIFMRRAGLPWLTIAKITGHQSVENLIKHYDLSLEVTGKIILRFYCSHFTLQGQGLAEVVGALAQGPAVAKGQDNHSIVLQTRASKRQKLSLKIEGKEVGQISCEKENKPPGNSEQQQLGSSKIPLQNMNQSSPKQPQLYQQQQPSVFHDQLLSPPNLPQHQLSLPTPMLLPPNFQHQLPQNYNQYQLAPNNQHQLPPNYNQQLMSPNYQHQLSPYHQLLPYPFLPAE